GVVVGEGNLDAQAIGAIVDAGIDGRVWDPGEIAVVLGVGDDVQQELRTLGRVLIEIDANGVFVGVVVGVPADRARLEELDVVVEIGRAQGDVGTSRGGIFGAGVAI